jgi:hypothetical protein
MPVSPRGGLMLDERDACGVQTISRMTWIATGVSRQPYECRPRGIRTAHGSGPP